MYSLNENGLKALISDRTIVIMEVEKNYVKKDLVFSAKERCSLVEKNAKSFKEQFFSLIELEFHASWTSKFKFFLDPTHEEKLLKKHNGLQNIKEGIEGLLGRIIMYSLFYDFDILIGIKKLLKQ